MTDWKPGDPLYPEPLPLRDSFDLPRWHDEERCSMCTALYVREPRGVVWSRLLEEAA